MSTALDRCNVYFDGTWTPYYIATQRGVHRKSRWSAKKQPSWKTPPHPQKPEIHDVIQHGREVIHEVLYANSIAFYFQFNLWYNDARSGSRCHLGLLSSLLARRAHTHRYMLTENLSAKPNDVIHPHPSVPFPLMRNPLNAWNPLLVNAVINECEGYWGTKRPKKTKINQWQ